MKQKKQVSMLTVGIVMMAIAVLLTGWRSVATAYQGGVEPSDYAGVAPDVRQTNVAADSSARGNTSDSTAEDGVQYINSSATAGSYEPITVQKGIPVKWTLNVPQDSLNGCNNRIFIPEYNLEVSLKTGDNLIEFTPDKSGKFVFSCWMGMIRSSITVTDEDGSAPQADSYNDGAGSLPKGCCG